MAGQAKETFLGLDIGTSSVKALLVDFDQRVLAEASIPLSVSRPHPLWSEENPFDWVEGVEAAVAAIRRHAPSHFAALSGIGLSGHMHGATLLDAQDKPLRPAILWNDGRSFAECAELKRRVPDLEQRTGNLAMPGFTAPKMLWVATHEPKIAKATRRVLLPKDYVRLRLSGEAVSEMSDASGTLWLDVGRRRWDETLLAATGLTEKAMPGWSRVRGPPTRARNRLCLGPGARFRLRRRRQRRLCDRVGLMAPGRLHCSDVGRLFLFDRFVASPSGSPRLAMRCRIVGARHGGDAFGRSSSSPGPGPGARGRSAIDRGATCSRSPAPSLPRRFSSPISARAHAPQRREATKCSRTRAGHGRRAGLWSWRAALLVRRRRRRSDAAAGRSGRCCWRGARSEFWAQMIADVTDLTIDLASGAEAGAALGAARLGMLAAGAGSVEAVCPRPPIQREFKPDPTRAAAYAPRLKRYHALYQAEKATRL